MAIAPPPPDAGWRRSLSSPRRFAAVSGLTLALVLLALMLAGYAIRAAVAPPALLGDEIHYPSSAHVPGQSLGPNPPLTPAGGHHYGGTVQVGIYDSPVNDGRAIHSLEHGIVWITYQPDLVSDAELATLQAIASDFAADTILSPRLENSFPVIIVSWERRLTQTDLDEAMLREFVSTNRNRSPEPGLR